MSGVQASSAPTQLPCLGCKFTLVLGCSCSPHQHNCLRVPLYSMTVAMEEGRHQVSIWAKALRGTCGKWMEAVPGGGRPPAQWPWTALARFCGPCSPMCNWAPWQLRWERTAPAPREQVWRKVFGRCANWVNARTRRSLTSRAHVVECSCLRACMCSSTIDPGRCNPLQLCWGVPLRTVALPDNNLRLPLKPRALVPEGTCLRARV